MVKKNSAKTSMFFKDKKSGRLRQRNKPVHYYTTAYLDWAKGAIQACAIYKTKHLEITFPITWQMTFKCLFFLKKNEVVDLSALYEGSQDIFAGNAGGKAINVPSNIYQIIEDDSIRFICSHDGSRVYLDYVNPRTEVYLIPFKL